MVNQNVADQISVFLGRIRNGRFDEESFRILESVLVAKDVKSLIEVRYNLRDSMKSELISVFREIADESVDRKLYILEFFVHAFALMADTESCLALRYEALTFRELKARRHVWLRVAHTEWIKFAEDSIEYGFYSIARKACENALACVQRDDSKEFSDGSEVADKIRRLWDFAVTSAACRSVQAESAKYLRSKEFGEKDKAQFPLCKRTEGNGSTLFRDGVKNRNERMLMELRSRLDCLPSTFDLTWTP